MHFINKYSLLNVSKNVCDCFKRYSSHFVYHPEPISNKLGKHVLRQLIFYVI